MAELMELPYEDDEVVRLTTSDDIEYTTTIGAVKGSETVRNLLGDCDLENAIPLPNVTGEILEVVLQYLNWHFENPTPVTEDDAAPRVTSEWDTQFCADQHQAVLFELILAANYLDIPNLLDLTCKAVAAMIKGKDTVEIRATFNIKNDFTPAEEEQVRKENEWVR